MGQGSIIESTGVYIPGILKDIKKSTEHFQPIFEAFTNSFESIKLATAQGSNPDTQFIFIEIFHSRKLTTSDVFFERIVIKDSGLGFDDESFKRLLRFKDDRKGFFNKGSGRIQFLHYFKYSKYVSSFCQGDAFRVRHFVLSTDHVKLKNAIVSGHEVHECERPQRETILTLEGLKDEADLPFYNDLNASALKEMLIARYIMEFCTHRNALPVIKIAQLLDENLIEETYICQVDIPQFDKQKDLVLYYYRPTVDGKDFEKTNKQETLTLTTFKIKEHELKRNELRFTSKGEIVPRNLLELKHISPLDQIDGNRYLFLVSGKYVDERDEDTRGMLNIRSREDSKKNIRPQVSLFLEGEIFIDDIEFEANKTISSIYPEIAKKKEDKQKDVEKLQQMFLLNPKTLHAVRISINDTEERILEKVYAADAKNVAKKDER